MRVVVCAVVMRVVAAVSSIAIMRVIGDIWFAVGISSLQLGYLICSCN